MEAHDEPPTTHPSFPAVVELQVWVVWRGDNLNI